MNSEFWNYLLATIGGAGALAAAIAWPFKTFISDLLSRKLAVLQNELAEMTSARNEVLKSELINLTHEHQIRFGLLHVKRGEVLSELYEHISNAFAHTLTMSLGAERTDLETQGKRAAAAFEAIRAAVDLLAVRKIWLSEDLASRIEKFLSELQAPSFKYHYYVKGSFSEQDVLNALREWTARREEVRELLHGIEEDFRAVLSAPSKRQV